MKSPKRRRGEAQGQRLLGADIHLIVGRRVSLASAQWGSGGAWAGWGYAT